MQGWITHFNRSEESNFIFINLFWWLKSLSISELQIDDLIIEEGKL